MNQNLQKISIFIRQADHLTDEEKATLTKAVKDTERELAISTSERERTEEVNRTTSILLDETIEELAQNRNAVKAQNRELEIEAALEKVRNKTMAMHNSQDIGDT